MAETRTLVLVRHAKSSWDEPGDDHNRPLAPRGERDARAVGRYLREQAIAPDLVLCSTAARARATADGIADGIADGTADGGLSAGSVRYLDEIYDASAAALVAVLRAVPEPTETVLMIGHAPGVPSLLEQLAVAQPDSESWIRATTKYPTSGVAILTVPVEWAAVAPGIAGLVSFEAPRA